MSDRRYNASAFVLRCIIIGLAVAVVLGYFALLIAFL